MKPEKDGARPPATATAPENIDSAKVSSSLGTMKVGWFRAMRNPEAFELIKANRNAFILLYVIAYRAQWSAGFNRYNLAMCEALLGDFETYGMTEQEYRTAKDQLERWGFATFRGTGKGTIATLSDASIFAVFTSTSNGHNNTQPTDSQRPDNDQPTTTKIFKSIKSNKSNKEESSPQNWQLSKDAERLGKQIREQQESVKPDKDLIAGYQTELRRVESEIRKLGFLPSGAESLKKPKANPPVPAVTGPPTKQPSPEELKEGYRKLREAAQ